MTTTASSALRLSVCALLIGAGAMLSAGCQKDAPPPAAAPGEPPIAQPLFDGNTLHAIAYDLNKNGKLDAWTMMDGARAVRADIDKNENGKIERWEYYDKSGRLEMVGMSYKDDGVVDAVVYQGEDGQIARMEIASRRTGKVERFEKYEKGVIKSADEDLDGDGKLDKWSTFQDGHVTSTAFDENSDGAPDRRLSYDEAGALVSVETGYDGKGGYRKKSAVGPR